jgi:hypothetical protein
VKNLLVPLFVAITLASVCLTAFAQDVCPPGMETACTEASNFASFLNRKARSEPSREHEFGISEANAVGGVVTIEHRYFHTEEEFHSLKFKDSSPTDFLDKLKALQNKIACVGPPGTIVRADGKYRAVYYFADGKLMLDETVSACPRA